MMNKAQAIAYGKRMGVKYYVKNENGGLLGGTRTLKEAKEMKAKFENYYANDPWNKGLKVYIEEC